MITNKEIAERLRAIADEVEMDESSCLTLKYERVNSILQGYGAELKVNIKTDSGSIKLSYIRKDIHVKVGESADQPSE
ncbi:MAG: hypothetical protein K2P74_04540 [Nitrosomonas sp.]|nr:hypothetical protein [Nitrosomonas sp.]